MDATGPPPSRPTAAATPPRATTAVARSLRRRAGSEPPATRDAGATRQRILAAAVAEFSRHGLGGARVDRIADAADANKRMLYYYFGSKDALFLAVLEQIYASIRSAERELNLLDAPPEEAIRRLASFTWHYYLDHPEFIPLLNSENLCRAAHLKQSPQIRDMHSPLVETLKVVLARGAEQGLFRAGIDPVQLYISIASLCYFYLSNAHTLSTIFGRDLLSASAKAQRLDHVSGLLVASLRP